MVNMVLMEVTGCKYEKSSNLKRLKEVYFSLKNRKFIKPITGKGTNWLGEYIYKLMPDKYLQFDYNYWAKGTPNVTLEISLIKIDPKDPEGKKYSKEFIKYVTIRYDKQDERLEILKDYPKVLEVTEDFVKAVPGYHFSNTSMGIKELTQKIYDEETVRELLNFINEYDRQELYYNPEFY